MTFLYGQQWLITERWCFRYSALTKQNHSCIITALAIRNSVHPADELLG